MARTFWSGHISFGLVTIPVKLATAVRDKSIHFRLLTPDGSCRLRRRLYCPETGKEYDFNETSRGYEIAPDQYVLIEEKELAALKPEAGRTIHIEQFAELEQIDPIYFSHTYYVVPDEAGARAYRLLMEAMKKSGRVALARFVMREKEHLATLRVKGGALLLHTMHYADEVISAQEAGAVAERVDIKAKEREMAAKLVESLDEPFDPDVFSDEYRQQVEAMIERKAAGEEIVEVAPEEEPPPQIINLAEALERSLRQQRRDGKDKRAPRRKYRKSA